MLHKSFKGVSWNIEECLNGVSCGSQGCSKEVQLVFEECFKGVSRMFRGSFRIFQGRLRCVPRDLQWSFKGIQKKIKVVSHSAPCQILGLSSPADTWLVVEAGRQKLRSKSVEMLCRLGCCIGIVPFINWHERAAFQSVGVRAANWQQG